MVAPIIYLKQADLATGEYTYISDQGIVARGSDKDNDELIYEYDRSGGFLQHLEDNGYNVTADKVTGPNLPAEGVSVVTFSENSGGSVVVPPSVVAQYDTIVGVGASIQNGVYELANGMFDEPYYGTTFTSASTPGTTLQYMIDNVSNFTSLVSGRTLFIVSAGGNDCNAVMSPGGVGDDDAGTGSILSWDELAQVHKDEAEARYRELIGLLQATGADVALSTFTYRDAKGLLSVMPDKGRNTHAGQWIDNLIVPLCRELTPDWFDFNTNRPKFDSYSFVINDPSMLDDDNLHFYDDAVFDNEGVAGYPIPQGSHRLRQYMLSRVQELTEFSMAPYDEDLYSDRILFNIGSNLDGVRGRKSYMPWANNLFCSSANEVYSTIKSYNSDDVGITFTVDFSSNGFGRNNLNGALEEWIEGCGDRNIVASGRAANNSHTHIYRLTGMLGKKGKISLIGVYSFGTADPAALNEFRITDDNGENAITSEQIVPSNTSVKPYIVEYDFDCTNSDELTIQTGPAGTATYGILSGFHMDILK
ncbi:hypothetical protein [Vibrio phage YC]|uniref:Uncharacterized protein n=1 Tax=Vibrio phage YC TaxID=2267403 RepID=A0A384ZS68_9CAUD|nr:hypothetical protein HWB64_gp108 [Vibrio phage YC]AXC34477.1 hypothetical protein [Vibrio phage YC]